MTGKAYFGLGAARQNKRTSEICDSIRSLLFNLNQVILVEDHRILVSVNQIVSCFQRDHQSSGGQSRAPFHDLVSKLHHLALSAAWMWRSLPATTMSSGPLVQRRGKL